MQKTSPDPHSFNADLDPEPSDPSATFAQELLREADEVVDNSQAMSLQMELAMAQNGTDFLFL